ncbi:MAG: glycoside hydrolase family 16 protein [Acholeplasma sp.]|nr:glycoside hydrolase family 16 protein [Acholeplasma sp.]
MYKLVWKDDFKKDGRPDEKIWRFEVGGHGFGNNEAQYYTDSDKNAYVKDGVLNIVAHKEKYKENNYTSAKLTTYKKKSIKYGKIIVCAKLPKGKGTWPAIWFLPSSIQEGKPWPLCGEIDLMEHVGKNPFTIHYSLHSKKYNHILNNQPTFVHKDDSVLDEFCKYELRWDEKSIAFYFNDQLQAKFENNTGDVEAWPFDQPFYLIINLAIGGWWGGEIDDSIFPVNFQISKVEVYEKE